MALNLNTSPYFDDFDGDKNYNRILFKPGVAVQARELTQLQTALSDQLSQLGSFTLKDGAIVSGCEERISKVKYIKVLDTDSSGDTIDNAALDRFVGATLTGGTTGITAQVIGVKTGLISDAPNLKTLYIIYTNRNSGTAQIFGQAETLTASSPNKNIRGKTFVTHTSGSDSTNPPGSRNRYEGTAPKIELSPGIIYVKGTFIRTNSLATFIDPYTFNTTKTLGFYVTEAVKTSADDSSLLDPASGSFNYNAPGADRLKLVASLRSYDQLTILPDNFFQYAVFENRKIIRSRIKENPLRELGDLIAKRAYDANGSYNIAGMHVTAIEDLNDGVNNGHRGATEGGDSTKINFVVSPGRANHMGYPIEVKANTLIRTDKPTATTTVEDVTQSTAYGNYIVLDELCGAWDIDGGDGSSGDGIVDLYGTAQNAVTGASYSATSVSGTIIGRAKFRHLVHKSGTQGAAACQYKLYLYDIKMQAGVFADVRSIVYENDNAKGIADAVLESSVAVLKEPNNNKLVWTLPYAHLKTFAPSATYDYTFIYQKEFDTTASAAGVITLDSSLLQTGQTFTFGNGTLTDAQITANINAVATDTFTAASTYTDGEHIDLTDSNVTVTQNSTTSLTIDLGGSIAASSRGVRVYVNVQYADVTPIAKTLEENKFVKIDAVTNTEGTASGRYCLGVSDVFRIVSITATSNSDYTTNAKNVTGDFVLDKGQRDNFYGLSHIKKKASSTLDLTTDRYLAVKVDFFSRSVNGPTFAVKDSYPVDDTGATGIKTEEIPLYTSSRNAVYDLRNAVDFRPYMTNTATTTGTLGSASENPSNAETIDRPSNGLTNPSPVNNLTTDLEYYLAQGYKVYVAEDGRLRVELDKPKDIPKLPVSPKNSLVLAKGVMPPYPCLSPSAGRYYNRRDLTVEVEQVRTRRYTMRDIGGLEKRIQNLEYYTALSNLENQTKNQAIYDNSGVDRFKNGLMIDAFKGFGTINVPLSSGSCSIDTEKRQLRAAFDHSIVEWEPATAVGTSVGQTGTMFHLKYHEAVYTKQMQASSLRNLVGELLYADPAASNATGQTASEIAATAIISRLNENCITPIITPPPEPIPPPVPAAPIFRLRRSVQQVNEGDSFTVYLETRNVTPGATVGYTITGVASADIGGVALTGTLTVDSVGDSSITFVTTEDVTTEGNETFTFTLDSTDSLGNATESRATSVIIVDTSQTAPASPPAPSPTPVAVPSYDYLNAPLEANEGDTVIWTVSTQNITDGTTVGYTITGIDVNDISSGSLTGNFTVTSNAASVSITLANDIKTEGEETATLTLASTDSAANSTGSLTRNVTINDTSVTKQEVISDPVRPTPPGPYNGTLNLIPEEDSWYDLDYAEPAYVNIEGDWDNLDIRGNWVDTWGSWEIVSTDVVKEGNETTNSITTYGGKVATTQVTETEQVDGGVNKIVYENWYQDSWTATETTTISAITEVTAERSGSSTLVYDNYAEETTTESEDILKIIAATFIRPQSITGVVEGLMPDAQHDVAMGSIKKTTVTTNDQGRGQFSFTIGEGEFECGNHYVTVTDSNHFDSITSGASAIFSANGQKKILQTTYTTTKWCPPAVGAIALFDSKTFYEGGELSSSSTPGVKTTVYDRTKVSQTFEPTPPDILVSTVCNTPADGTATQTWQRGGNSSDTYTVTVQDASCVPAADPICEEGYYYNATFGICMKEEPPPGPPIIHDAVTVLNALSGSQNTVVARFDSDVLTTFIDQTQGGRFGYQGGFDTDTEGATESIIELLVSSDRGYDPYIATLSNASTDPNLTSIATTAAQVGTTIASGTINYDFDINLEYGDFFIDENCGRADPIAQTFFVTGLTGGMFVPNIKVYFRHVPAEGNNNGVTLQIREVVNGSPSTTVVPNGSRHLRRSEVFCSNTNADGTHNFIATTFKFRNLVHLENDKEYAIVLVPDADDPNYVAYTGKLGETVFGTTQTITKQAHGGVFFTSANNKTWTPHQDEDLMFVVTRCAFKTGEDQTLTVQPKNYDWLKFSDSGWETGAKSGFSLGDAINGFTFTISNAGAGYGSAPTVTIADANGLGTGATATATLTAGAVTAITLTDPGSGFTSESSITVTLSGGSPTTAAVVTATLNRGVVKFIEAKYKTFKVQVTDGRFYSSNTVSNPAQTLVGTTNTYGTISSIEDRVVSAYVNKVSEINPSGKGTITRTIALTDTGAGSVGSTYVDMPINKTVELNTEKTIYSYSNEAASYSGNKSATAKFVLRSENNNISPMIDMSSMAMGVYKNIINNDASNEEVRFGGSATMKYISKTIVLADGQDAEDMKVYLDSAIPSTGGVRVYGKFMSKEDDGEMNNDIYWKQLELEASPLVSTETFAEYVYKLPAKGSTTSGLNGSGIFEYDVDRISSIAVSSGGSGYSSAPTVTITHTGDGYGATAEAILSGGAVSEIKITNPGRGYTGGTITATLTGGSPSVAATLGTPATTTVTFASYKYFAIKIVHTNSTSVKIPKSAGLRAFALQA